VSAATGHGRGVFADPEPTVQAIGNDVQRAVGIAPVGGAVVDKEVNFQIVGSPRLRGEQDGHPPLLATTVEVIDSLLTVPLPGADAEYGDVFVGDQGTPFDSREGTGQATGAIEQFFSKGGHERIPHNFTRFIFRMLNQNPYLIVTISLKKVEYRFLD